MAHRASVALPSEDQSQANDTVYEIYHSHNGGLEFRLYPVLKDIISDGDISRLQQLPNRPPENVQDLLDAFEMNSEWETIQNDQPIIEKEPTAVVQDRESIFEEVNALTEDVLYIVGQDGGVDTYYMSYFMPMLQSFFHTDVVVDVYPDTHIDAMKTGERGKLNPYYRFEKDAWLHPTEAKQYRQDSPPINEVFERIKGVHSGFLQSIFIGLQNGRSSGEYIIQGDYTYELTHHGSPSTKYLKLVPDFGIFIEANDLGDIPRDIIFNDINTREAVTRWEASAHFYENNDPRDIDGDKLDEIVDTAIRFAVKEFGDDVVAKGHPENQKAVRRHLR